MCHRWRHHQHRRDHVRQVVANDRVQIQENAMALVDGHIATLTPILCTLPPKSRASITTRLLVFRRFAPAVIITRI